MAVPVVHQRPAVGELLPAHVARHCFAPVGQHVPLETRLVVERLGALAARKHLLLGVLPGVFEEGAAVLAGAPAQQARVGRQALAVLRLKVRVWIIFNGTVVYRMPVNIHITIIRFKH